WPVSPAGAVGGVVAGAVVADVVVGAAVVVVAWPSTMLPFCTVVDVAALAVVVVAPAAVVVVAPGAVVVVVTSMFSGGRPSWRTGRNRSSAVWPTMSMARARSFTPGRSMMMLLPCRLISGSATPRESTRLR